MRVNSLNVFGRDGFHDLTTVVETLLHRRRAGSRTGSRTGPRTDDGVLLSAREGNCPVLPGESSCFASQPGSLTDASGGEGSDSSALPRRTSPRGLLCVRETTFLTSRPGRVRRLVTFPCEEHIAAGHSRVCPWFGTLLGEASHLQKRRFL